MVELARRIGEAEVARWCAGLLQGTVRHDDPRRPPITWLGGPHAANVTNRPESRELLYFPRVWAARGLLYAWDAAASAAVAEALADPAWRVREMAAKVARARRLTGAKQALERLETDPVPRVRAAATKALDELRKAPEDGD